MDRAEPERDASRTAAIAAIELLASPACLLAASGDIVHLNKAWRAFAGLDGSPDDAIGWERLVHGDHRDPSLPRRLAASRDGDQAGFECRLRDRHGAPRWFVLAAHALDGDADRADRVCAATDIEAIKLREAALRQRESIQADMLNISVDCIKLIDPDGRLSHMNKAGCLALGVAEGSSLGMPWLSLLPEDVREAGEAALAAARTGVPGRFPGRSVVPGEAPQHWDNLLTPVVDAQGRVTGILCVSREVTAERAALESLRESEERLSIATRVGGLGIWDYDIPRDRLHCDDSWYRIMGRDREPPITSVAGFRPFIHPDDVERATDIMRTAAELLAAEQDYSISFRIVRPNGDVRWIRSLAHLEHRDGMPVRAVGFVADVTDTLRGELALRDANRTLREEKLSLSRELLEDPLTGISNRRHLDAEFDILRARSAGNDEPLCIGLVDVDHFKQFNDLYGHLDGDAALRSVATALRSAARHSDLVARYGGEEFAFVLPATDDPTPVLEKFMAAIADLAIPHRGSPVGRLTISCGAVAAHRSPLSTRQLFKESDEALYEAKLAGRNRYVVRFAKGA